MQNQQYLKDTVPTRRESITYAIKILPLPFLIRLNVMHHAELIETVTYSNNDLKSSKVSSPCVAVAISRQQDR